MNEPPSFTHCCADSTTLIWPIGLSQTDPELFDAHLRSARNALCRSRDDAVHFADSPKSRSTLAGSVMSARYLTRRAHFDHFMACNSALTAWPSVPVAPITTIFFIRCSVE